MRVVVAVPARRGDRRTLWPPPHSAGQSGSTPASGFGEAASGRERPASSRAGPGSRKSQAGRGRFRGSGGPGGPASHSRKRFPTESRVFVRPAREVRALTCRSQVTGLGWGGGRSEGGTRPRLCCLLLGTK